MSSARVRAGALAVVVGALLISGCTDDPDDVDTRVVQLGAPGESPTEVSPDDLGSLEGTEHTAADVDFVTGMIHHHAQALEMTALVPERTASLDLPKMAERMEISQGDEIAQMEQWLSARGEEVPTAADHSGHGGHGSHGGGHGAHGGTLMPGMLNEEQMAALEAASGAAFDQLFLQSMIYHHEGALSMVRDLYAAGAGQETTVFQMAEHIDSDQRIEIARMRAMLAEMAR